MPRTGGLLAAAACLVALTACSSPHDTATLRVADEPSAVDIITQTDSPSPSETPTAEVKTHEPTAEATVGPSTAPPVEATSSAPSPPAPSPTWLKKTGAGFYADEPGGRVYNHPPLEHPDSLSIKVVSKGNGGPPVQNLTARYEYPHQGNGYEIDVCLHVTWDWPAGATGPVLYSQHDHWEDDSTAEGGNHFTEPYKHPDGNNEYFGCQGPVYFDDVTADISVDDGAVIEIVGTSKLFPCIYTKWGRCN